jgi:hypothetical protein
VVVNRAAIYLPDTIERLPFLRVILQEGIVVRQILVLMPDNK